MNHLLILCVISAGFFIHQTFAENENVLTNVTIDSNKTYAMNQTNAENINVTNTDFINNNNTEEAAESNFTKKPDLRDIMLQGFLNLTESGVLPLKNLIDKYARHLLLDNAILQASEKFRNSVTNGTIDYCNKAAEIKIHFIRFAAEKAAEFCLFLDYMSIAYPQIDIENDNQTNTNETHKSSKIDEADDTRKSLIELFLDESIEKHEELTKNDSSSLMLCYNGIGSRVDDFFVGISLSYDNCTIEHSQSKKLAKKQSFNLTEIINITNFSTTTEIPTTTLSLEEKASRIGVSPEKYKSLFEVQPEDDETEED